MSSRRKSAPPSLSATATPSNGRPVFLGIEGGGTHTTALLADAAGTALAHWECGPASLKIHSDRHLLAHFRAIAAKAVEAGGDLQAVAVGLAGVRTDEDHDRLRALLRRAWPGVPTVATNDLETALAAAPKKKAAVAQVLVLSGTGSCCFGRRFVAWPTPPLEYAGNAPDGLELTAKVGGRGHVIGDRGSATDIGQQALRAVMAHWDREARWPALGALILEKLGLNDPDDLIPWSLAAKKTELAALAVAVFEAAEAGEAVAKAVLEGIGVALAEDAAACARRLALAGETVQFVFNGAVLLKNPAFCRQVSRGIEARWPAAVVTPLEVPSVAGAVALAQRGGGRGDAGLGLPAGGTPTPPCRGDAGLGLPAGGTPTPPSLAALSLSPTEMRNPRSAKLDTMPLREAVSLMLDEEAGVPAALLRHRADIVWVVRKIVAAFRSGGRLFYVGAGTSGRLGVLDASECPPTFRTPPSQVQGIIAGGEKALRSAVEGAEDDAEAAEKAIAFRHVGKSDVVIGIAASGRTPFAWGALEEAARRGATTVLVCFNPQTKRRASLPDRLLAIDLGPEVLTGSTRLKCGTATKLLLNAFSTLGMARTGKVIGNLMIDLNPSNVKLRDRACRIVRDLTGVPHDEAKAALEAHGWVVKHAYEALKHRKAGSG